MKKTRTMILALAGGLLIGLLVTALYSGSAPVSPVAAWQQWRAGDSGGLDFRIVAMTRLPRILLSMTAGAALALAGCATQSLFRNPLASPYVIGISNSAAAGAAIWLLTAGSAGLFGVATGGILGGLAGLLLLRLLANRGGDGGFGGELLLIGIALNAFFSALVAGALFVAQERLQGVVFWMLGGFWGAEWYQAAVLAPVMLVALGWLYGRGNALDVALLDPVTAQSSGVNLVRLQRGLLLIAAVLTALTVSFCGVIGFIGLIVPHWMRLLVGAHHRRLVPGAAVGGALLMLGADTLARTLAQPAEIPVGILTALVGAPAFIVMIRSKKNKNY